MCYVYQVKTVQKKGIHLDKVVSGPGKERSWNKRGFAKACGTRAKLIGC